MIDLSKLLRAAALIIALTLLAGCASYFMESDEDGDERLVVARLNFNPSLAALRKALALDIQSHNEKKMTPMSWIELLAYVAAKNGNDFSKYENAQLDELAAALQSGKRMQSLAAGLADYAYYRGAYAGVLGGYVGEYEVRQPDANGELAWTKRYGLKAFSPIAGNYIYADGDDFGVSRLYGDQHWHQGHDLFGDEGTPIAAVESGVVEELGWSKYDGWIVKLRSLDRKRVYFYSHLRKKHPYHTSLMEGSPVLAGDIIGYMGKTGYTTLDNTGNAGKEHLHFGLQVFFGKEGQGEGIWIDTFALTRLLNQNRSASVRDEATDEFSRVYAMREVQNTPAFNAAPEEAAADLDARASVQLPIVMYHFVLERKVASGDIYITPDGLRQDLDFLVSNGFSTVTIDELIAYVHDGAKLPEKPVLLTFDDGFYNNLHYAEPLLKERGMRAMMAVVGEFSQDTVDTGDINVRYSYVTWDQIRQAAGTGVFEFQSHSWALHRLAGAQGVKRKRGESAEAYVERLEKDLTKLSDKLEELTGKRPTAFAYPFGAFSDISSDALQDIGFLVTMTSTEGVNTLVRGDPSSLIHMDRYTRKAGEGTERFFGRVLKKMA